MKKNIQDPFIAWQKFVVKNSQSEILRKLEELIQDDGGLFRNDPAIQEFRNLSLLFRIDLLIEWKRYGEALAWLCLETELNPLNVEAQALKEYLKRELHFTNVDNRVSVNTQSSKPLFDWGKVAGMRKIKAMIERDILLPLKERDVYRNFNVTIPKGLLLYGPPGCGKTFIVQNIARLLNFKFIEISPSSIASTYVHGTQEKIKELFEEASQNRPALVFIDELEAFVPSRNRVDVSFHYQAEVNELLVQLNNAHQNGVFVVGATNNLDMIDEAIKRPGRFDQKIYVGPPDLEARIDAFKKMLVNKPNNVTKWLFIGEETENYTFAEIEYIVQQAARNVASQGSPVITLNDLMKVVVQNPPEFDRTE
jgi:transitional endoplasmic reticulum ATPase